MYVYICSEQEVINFVYLSMCNKIKLKDYSNVIDIIIILFI